MNARCKFALTRVTDNGYGLEVVLTPRYDANDPKDTAFSTATPSGEFKMQVNNPAVLPMFKDKVGKVFYLDISPVDED